MRLAIVGNWRRDLESWLAPFVVGLRHKTRARMCPACIAGLTGPGDRKSVQPMAARDVAVSYDQLHRFIASEACDTAPLVAALLAEADRMVGGEDAWLIVDDTALPKKGDRSVGVARPTERRDARARIGLRRRVPEARAEHIEPVFGYVDSDVNMCHDKVRSMSLRSERPLWHMQLFRRVRPTGGDPVRETG